MSPSAVLITILGIGIQWVMRIFLKILINWWLQWIQKLLRDATIVSDFKVCRQSVIEPPGIVLYFTIHNGTSSSIVLRRIILHLYCQGAWIASLASPISDNPLINTDRNKLKRGGRTRVAVNIVPDVRFWLGASPPDGFSLSCSSVEISTVWGNVSKPLNPDSIESDMGNYDQIKEYIAKIGRSLTSIE